MRTSGLCDVVGVELGICVCNGGRRRDSSKASERAGYRLRVCRIIGDCCGGGPIVPGRAIMRVVGGSLKPAEIGGAAFRVKA